MMTLPETVPPEEGGLDKVTGGIALPSEFTVPIPLDGPLPPMEKPSPRAPPDGGTG